MKTRALLIASLVVSLVATGIAGWVLLRPTHDDALRAEADQISSTWGDFQKLITKSPSAPSTPSNTPTPQKTSLSSKQKTGKAFAVIHIPKLNLEFPIVQGIDTASLKKGIGHYPQTVMPGAIGNFSVAGHSCCESNGQPFKNLSKLRSGDVVYVETSDGVYTYTILEGTECGVSPLTVHMSKIEVINPVPCSTDKPTERLMTLHTCTPWNGAPATRRIVTWAMLTKFVPRS